MKTTDSQSMTATQRHTAASNPKERITRVLLVDDHPLVLKGIAEFIKREADMEVCGEAANGAQALELISQSSPDIISVDLTLGGGRENGIDLIKKARAQHPEIGIVVFSMHEETEFSKRALRAGAAEYVLKRDSPEMLIQAIRRIRDL